MTYREIVPIPKAKRRPRMPAPSAVLLLRSLSRDRQERSLEEVLRSALLRFGTAILSCIEMATYYAGAAPISARAYNQP